MNLEETMFRDIIKLYNSKHNADLKIKMNKIFQARDLKAVIDSAKNEYLAVMSSLTITDERKKWASFSTPYLPIKETLFSTKQKFTEIPTSLKNKRISYFLHTTEQRVIKKLVNRDSIIPVDASSIEMKKDLINDGLADYFISDNVILLSIKNIVPVIDLDIHKNLNYGIVYPKNSILKRMLDPIIKYYIKSDRFYKRLDQFSDKKTADYFIKHVKNSFR